MQTRHNVSARVQFLVQAAMIAALYTVLTDAASPVKAVSGLDVGGSEINAMAITATADTAREAARTLVDTCTAICRELNTTTHLALWRRYLRTVWLHI